MTIVTAKITPHHINLKAPNDPVVANITTQHIVLDPISNRITVINGGPQGPPGIGGASTTTYLHEQDIASTSWLMSHNLGFYPNVDVFDNSGRRIRSAIIHHSINQTEVQFLTPRTGIANLS